MIVAVSLVRPLEAFQATYICAFCLFLVQPVDVWLYEHDYCRLKIYCIYFKNRSAYTKNTMYALQAQCLSKRCNEYINS